MNRPSNEDLKYALLEARDNVLSNKHGGYICNCLPNTDAGNYLCRFIADAIKGYSTLGIWVCHNVIGLDNQFPSDADMKAYRLRWIDYMLEGL